MPDLLASSAATHAQLRQQWASSPVTYSRNGFDDLIGLLAEFAKMEQEVIGADGNVYISTDQYQFRFLTTDLVIDGQQATPKTSDRITDAAGVTYEVMPITGYNAWEWTDRNLRIRVFCKRVAGL